MLLRIALAVAMLLTTIGAVSACLASPETIHNREIALIYNALKKTVLTPDDLAMVKKLEAQAERLHRVGKFEQAQKARHTALTTIGYRYQPAPVSAASPQGEPTGVQKPGTVASGKGCGGSGEWVAPNS